MPVRFYFITLFKFYIQMAQWFGSSTFFAIPITRVFNRYQLKKRKLQTTCMYGRFIINNTRRITIKILLENAERVNIIHSYYLWDSLSR